MTIGCIYFVYAKTKKDLPRILKDDWLLAIQSAKSLKEHMPNIKISVYTNFEINIPSCFDYHIVWPGFIDLWKFKYQCLLDSPYDITLHLDADTFVCDNFSEVFIMMDRFDLVMPFSVTYIARHSPDIPDSFPELAGGFMVFKKSDIAQEFLFRTLHYVINRSGGCDEPCIRRAVYETDIRYAVIPWEYNCLYIHPGYVFGKIKVMHGRRKTIKEDAKIMNTKVYDQFPPYKRIFTGDRLYLFKKTRQKMMKVVKEIPYQQGGSIRA